MCTVVGNAVIFAKVVLVVLLTVGNVFAVQLCATGFPLTWECQGIDMIRKSQGILLMVRENFVYHPCF